jgi:hypothetical protein
MALAKVIPIQSDVIMIDKNLVIIIGGKKEKVVERLLKWKEKKKNIPELRTQIRNYLSPTQETLEGSRPVIQEHYHGTFNLVDRFNRLASWIAFHPRQTKEEICWLVNLLIIAAVQCWVLILDWNKAQEDQESETNLCKFVVALAHSLRE